MFWLHSCSSDVLALLKMSRYKLDFPIFAAVILCLLFQEGVAYKHVIFMHGLLSDPSEFGDFHRFIQKVGL